MENYRVLVVIVQKFLPNNFALMCINMELSWCAVMDACSAYIGYFSAILRLFLALYIALFFVSLVIITQMKT